MSDDAAAVGPQQHEQAAQLAPAAAGLAQAAAQLGRSSVRVARGRSRRERERRRGAHAGRVVAPSQARHLRLERLAREEDLVGQALLDDLAVERRALEQLLVRAVVDQPRRPRARDLVGERDRREAVGDDERRAAAP